ncbi:MAG: phage tail tube protein [Dehalococcoidales bacterium]|jgi:hypothetical protein
MATYRGLSVNGTTLLPVSGVSMSVARNLIAEETMSAVGESKLFGGTYLSSGTIDGIYRTDLDVIVEKLFGQAVTSGLGELPASGAWFNNIYVSDEFGHGYKVASVMITSMDLNVQTKDFAKVSFNWIGGDASADTHSFSVAPTYSNSVSVFYNTTITVNSVAIKCMNISVRVERPIDQDYYILGHEYLDDYVQSGAVTVSGSIGLGPKEWSDLQNALSTDDPFPGVVQSSNANDIEFGEIEILLAEPTGTSVIRTITIPNCKISDATANVTGRNKFEKTINWRAETTASSKIIFS